ncbi:unnamed protein product [Cylindrotheca closterium]|uniref:Uncharacterized protein n=1 Tax=Cylindrotheca closterium TaxID=2856 RepID=A0AAD2G791_9STRA|nr:unnamed protein product [Cylindrotheca closterium]
MTITDFTVRKKSYRYLTTQASYPNHDSKAVLDAFDPTKDLQMQDLNSLVEKGVPQLEAWLINEELEQDHSKLFVMEDITDEDPETAYDLLVTHKRMPIPKEFLDIAWDGSSARKVLRLVIDRIKILANSEEPEKNSKVHEKFRHFVDHWRVANTVIGRDQLLKNVGEPAVLTATSARRWVSGVINSDFARLDSEDSIGDSPDKTYELLTKTLAAVEESNKTTKTSVESLSEVVVAGIHGQASDKAPPNTVEKKWCWDMTKYEFLRSKRNYSSTRFSTRAIGI